MLDIIPVNETGSTNPNDVSYLFCENGLPNVHFALNAHSAERLLERLDGVLSGKGETMSVVLGDLVASFGETHSQAVSFDGHCCPIVMIYPHGNFANMKFAEQADLLRIKLKAAFAEVKMVAEAVPA